MPGSLQVTFAGAEVNVAVAITMLGCSAEFVTALPDNVISDACIRHLRGLGVDVSGIARCQAGRMGTYFLESGKIEKPNEEMKFVCGWQDIVNDFRQQLVLVGNKLSLRHFQRLLSFKNVPVG